MPTVITNDNIKYLEEKNVSNTFQQKEIEDENKLLHLFSFKTPTLWAVMSVESVAYCASSMRNGVKEKLLQAEEKIRQLEKELFL